MKKISAWLFILVITAITLKAQDTMYVHYHRGFITKFAVNQIDSIVFHTTSRRITAAVYILWGQSNMGMTSVTNIPSDSSMYSGLISGVNIFNPAYLSEWQPLKVGVNTHVSPNKPFLSNGFGAEASLGYNLKQNPENNIFIIKYGVSGTSMNSWALGTTEYNNLISGIKNSLKSLTETGYNIDIKGFVTMQGESDAEISSSALNYLSRFSCFFNNINHEINAFFVSHSLPTDTSYIKVVGRIGTYDFGNQNTVRNAQKEYCDDVTNNAYLIDTDFYSRQNDGVHFSALGQLQFGWDCYNILKNK